MSSEVPATSALSDSNADPEKKKPKKKAGLKFEADVVEIKICVEEDEEPENDPENKPKRLPTNMRKKAGSDGVQEDSDINRMVTAAVKVCEDSDIDPEHGLRSKKSCLNMDHLKDAEAVRDKYTQVKQLGEGGFGTVMEVVDKNDKDAESLALKIIPRVKVDDPISFKNELDIAKKLKHPNIVKLHMFFEDETNFYLVMEICSDGDLFDKISDCFNPFSGINAGIEDNLVTPFAWQMLRGLAYLHFYKFAHRDIKPENYMLKKDTLKLIDFGLARSFRDGVPMTSKVGTMAYCAPEILFTDGYSEPCDLWSIGCVFIVMMTGSPPFLGANDDQTMQKVKEGVVNWDDPRWKNRPKDMKAITVSVMKVDPKERPTAASLIKENEYLRSHSEKKPDGGCCVVS